MSNVAESQIITNTAISDKRVENPLEKLPRHLFFSTIEFFIDDVESLINFRRCSKKTFSLCNEGLHIHLERIKELNLSHLSFIRLLPKNNNNTNPLFPFAPNLTHLKLDYNDASHSYKTFNLSKILLGLNQNCKNFKSVSFHSFTAEMLDFLLPFIPSEIARLELDRILRGNLGNKLLVNIAAKFSNLECLKIDFSSFLLSDLNSETRLNLGIRSLLTKCVKLKILHIEYLKGLDEQDADYFSYCKDITDLSINGTRIGARGVQKIVESCTKLTALDIRQNKLDDEAMLAICTNCRNLTEFYMEMCTPSQFLMLAKCTQLTTLSIFCQITDSDFEYVLRECKQLKNVSIFAHNLNEFDTSKFPQIDFIIF